MNENIGRWYHNLLTILFLIGFFPIGIYSMWKKTTWNVAIKIFITGIYLWIIGLILATIFYTPILVDFLILLLVASPLIGLIYLMWKNARWHLPVKLIITGVTALIVVIVWATISSPKTWTIYVKNTPTMIYETKEAKKVIHKMKRMDTVKVKFYSSKVNQKWIETVDGNWLRRENLFWSNDNKELIAEKEKLLLAKAKSIPHKKYKENIAVYRELSELVTTNVNYKEKVRYYEGLVRKQKEAENRKAQAEKKAIEEEAQAEKEAREQKAQARSSEEQRRIKKHGDRPFGNKYDVMYFLKRIANDPDSVKVSRVSDIYYNEDDGWLLLVEWRAKNAYGGYVKNVNWFVIRFSQVVSMKEANAYNPY